MSEKNFEKIMAESKPKITQSEKDIFFANIEKQITAPELILSPYKFSNLNKNKMTPLLIALLVLTGVGSTVVTADAAKPGDFLFPIDQATERLQLALVAEDNKNTLRTEFADERILELRKIIEQERRPVANGTVDFSNEGELKVSEAVKIIVDLLDEVDDSELRQRLLLEVENEVARKKSDDDFSRGFDDKGDDRKRDDKDKYEDDSHRSGGHNNGDDSHSRVYVSDDNLEIRSDDYRIRIDDEIRVGIKKLEVEVEDGMAEVKFEFNDRKIEYKESFVGRDELVRGLMKVSGLTQAEIESSLELKIED